MFVKTRFDVGLSLVVHVSLCKITKDANYLLMQLIHRGQNFSNSKLLSMSSEPCLLLQTIDDYCIYLRVLISAFALGHEV